MTYENMQKRKMTLLFAEIKDYIILISCFFMFKRRILLDFFLFRKRYSTVRAHYLKVNSELLPFGILEQYSLSAIHLSYFRLVPELNHVNKLLSTDVRVDTKHSPTSPLDS